MPGRYTRDELVERLSGRRSCEISGENQDEAGDLLRHREPRLPRPWRVRRGLRSDQTVPLSESLRAALRASSAQPMRPGDHPRRGQLTSLDADLAPPKERSRSRSRRSHAGGRREAPPVPGSSGLRRSCWPLGCGLRGNGATATEWFEQAAGVFRSLFARWARSSSADLAVESSIPTNVEAWPGRCETTCGNVGCQHDCRVSVLRVVQPDRRQRVIDETWFLTASRD